MNKKSLTLYSLLFLGVGGLIAAASALFMLANPALASMMNSPVPTHEALWAAVDISKPTATAVDVSTPMPFVREPEVQSPIPTETPVLVMQIVDESGPSAQPQPMDDDRWIDVNLSQQQIYIYERDALVNTFIVSTGLPDTPTVTGEYRIYVKVPIQDMSGPGYYLPDVPWVMYFYDEYGFHGTYWHNNFGTPMSRGCVNLRVDDAAWLYDWASVGTRVSVHY
jgi:lipoprotein-anchoring transpeptidase ErfK/SrfK